MTGSRRSQTPKRATPEVHTPRLKSPVLGGSRKPRRRTGRGTKSKSRSRKNAHRK